MGTVLLQLPGVHYVFVGADERRQYNAAALNRLRAALTVVFEDGDTFVARVPEK